MGLELPSPSLVVLVGPSGAGKTTWAKANFATSDVVSSDALRAMVGAGEDDQTASAAAFDLLERIVSERLRRRLTTVVDTLGFDTDRRRGWVARSAEAGIPAFAIVFDTPPATCEERNAARTRPIPKTVLKRQISRFRRLRSELAEDGFEEVIVNSSQRQETTPVPTPSTAAPEAEAADETARRRHTFGLIVSRMNWEEGARGQQLADIAARAEKAGFRDIWVMDHFRQIRSIGRPWEDLPEAYTALGYMAAATRTIRLGALVSGVTHRPPIVLGKMVATLDALSGGRAWCGLGIAWDESEHDAFGLEFPEVRVRYEVLEETLQMLPLLWGSGTPEFRGRHIRSPELICYPRPVQDPIPIIVGGSGERKTLPLVARYADACNLFGDPDRVRHKSDVLRSHCEELGRDPDEVEVTHLVTALAAPDRRELGERLERLRDRNTPAETYARRNNAGTVGQLVDLFDAYSSAGADHSIVALPDVSLDGSIESFGEVIANFGAP